MGKGLNKSSANSINAKVNQDLSRARKNSKAVCPKGKLEFKFFQVLIFSCQENIRRHVIYTLTTVTGMSRA